VSDPGPPKDFETALAELERIVASMEGQQLPLAESLSAYKRGAELVAFCQAALKDAQQQIEILERGVRKTFSPAGGADDAP
jgi:exodeoxyribonuclease VII small subunit